MVKKASSVKSKKVSETKSAFGGAETVELASPAGGEKIEELATEAPKKESAPQVMQVVEVMDEEAEIPEVAAQIEEKNDVEMTHTEIIESEPTIKETPKTEEEKKQEVVSEFFTKKPASQGGEPITATFGYPDISVHKKSAMPGVLLWALGVIILVVAIGATIIGVSRGSVKMPTFAAKPTPTPTSAPLPTATPTPAVDKKLLKIEVLNGSGTAGMAGKMKTLLEGKGYTVAGTGNAKSYDYAKTEIQVTADNEKFISVLTADLSGSYIVGSSAATLKSTLPYNAVVIIGKE